MKPILVHVHVFYFSIWEEIKLCLLEIPCNYDLFITISEQISTAKNNIETDFPNAKVKIVKNLGYDVGPFVDLLSSINLDNYSFILKLHTKRDMPEGSMLKYFDVSGTKWRYYSLYPFKNKKRLNKCIRSLCEDPRLGMISNYHLILKKEYFDKKASEKAKEYAKKLGLNDSRYAFVAGTIFMCKAELFKPIQHLNLVLENFDLPDQNHKTSSLAHIIERLFGVVVVNQGYKIDDVFSIDNGLLKKIFFRFFKLIRL